MRLRAAVVPSVAVIVVGCSPAGPPTVASLGSVEPTADLSARPAASMAQVDTADPEDTRPTDFTVPAPAADFSPTPLPADVHLEPPADGWWTKNDACPAGAHVVKKPVKFHGHPWTGYHCDGKGGPTTTIRDDADEREEGWWDADGKPHGAIRWLTFAYDETRLYVHGVKEGRWTDRARDGSQDSFESFRAGRCHGEVRRDLGERASGGWCVDGSSEGTWLVWNKNPNVVRARLRYRGGGLDGPQRWWTRGGDVLARGAFVAGEGTWTLLPPGGKWRVEIRCKGDDLVETKAWDVSSSAGSAIPLHVCGRQAPPGCIATGTADERALAGLDAKGSICGDPTVPPLGLL